MTNFRKLFDQAGMQPYLGHWDLEVNGKFEPKEVIIEKFYVAEMNTAGGKENKVMANIQGYKKPMIVNKENFKRLRKLFGTEDYEQYVGKPVVLTVEQTYSASDRENVDCLRFSTRPLPKKELPLISAAEMETAKTNIAAGRSTVDKVKSHRRITPDQEKELLAIKK